MQTLRSASPRTGARTILAPCCVLFSLLQVVTTPLFAQYDGRVGFDGTTIASPRTSTVACGQGTFLVGLTQTQTDRLIGVSYDCVAATKRQTWDTPTHGHIFGFGNFRGGTPVNKTCPPDYFLVGLKATFGSYSADTHGAAKPVPPRLIADLAPVCRNYQGVYFEFTRATLTQAEDNDLKNVAWDGIGGPRSCKAGYAVMRINFRYDGRRDIDPANRFYDAALTCRRLPVNIPGMADTKLH